MIRYFAIATVIVLAVAVIMTAYSNRDRLFVHLRPTSAPTDLHGGVGGDTRGARGLIAGDAPWALSALPDCFRQVSESSGSLAYVRSKLPAGATAIASGTVFPYGPCTISVGDGEVTVTRGSDRLRVPPHATLYRADETLALLRTSVRSADLRIYTTP